MDQIISNVTHHIKSTFIAKNINTNLINIIIGSLTIKLDIILEIFEGAIGCALGSQISRGHIHAFAQNQIKAAKKAIFLKF